MKESLSTQIFIEFYECHKCVAVKSNLLLYSLQYTEACYEFAGPISASVRPGNTATFEEMSQRWRAVGNTVPDLTGRKFELQTNRSRDEGVTARPTVRNIIEFVNTREKFEFSLLIVKTAYIVATQLRSSIKPLRSLHTPFLKLYSLENLVG